MGDLRRINYAVKIEIGKILFTEVHVAPSKDILKLDLISSAKCTLTVVHASAEKTVDVTLTYIKIWKPDNFCCAYRSTPHSLLLKILLQNSTYTRAFTVFL